MNSEYLHCSSQKFSNYQKEYVKFFEYILTRNENFRRKFDETIIHIFVIK